MPKLYKISRESYSWDEWTGAIVCADDEDHARSIHPSGDNDNWGNVYGGWVSDAAFVDVEYVGEAADNIKSGSVVLASFNAG